MNTEQFLRAVLPSSGNYFLALPFTTSKGYKHLPYTSTEEMARKAVEVSERGINVYFACAAFAEPEYVVTDKDGKQKTKYRTGDNALFAKSQWLDLDGSQKENLVQLTEFCEETGLPRPNIRVNSGNGLHVYWTFERDVPKDHWLVAARIFKDICAHYRLGQEDTSRTADIASVLRPIGTNNDKTRKGLGVKPVKLLGTTISEPIPFKEWLQHLKRIRDDLGIKTAPAFKAPVSNINDDLSIGTEYPPASGEVVANHCKQMSDFREFRGVGQSEPLWRACVGVLKATIDGEELVHAWSSGHEEYDVDATQEKFDNWKTNPTTCKMFESINPKGCEGCRFQGKKKSPIQLGEVPPEPDEPVEYIDAEGEVKVSETAPLPERFNEEFRASAAGLHAAAFVDGVAKWFKLSEAIPRIVEYYQDSEDQTWKAIVHAEIKPGVVNKAMVEAKVIGQGGSALTGTLAGNLCVTTLPGKVRLMENYMHTWIEEIRRSNEETAMYTHMGWYDDGSFLWGNRKYEVDGTVKKVMLKASVRRLADTMVPHGDLSRYKQLLDKAYNRPNHQAHQFTWLAGIGSVLLHIVHPEPLGIVFDGWSTDSGYGKTTVAKLATGIWGKPDLVGADGTTEYALTYNAGLRKNMPMLLDESTGWDGKKLGKFAYNYGMGRAKEQGKADGGVRDNSSVNWCNILFSTGNKSMSGKIISDHANGAPQIARILEYEFRTPHSEMLDEFEGPEVFAEMFEIYGVVAETVLPYIVQHRESLKAEIIATRQKLQREAALKQDARFWAIGSAATIVAERVAKDLGLHNFDTSALWSWTINQLAGMRATSKSAVKDVSLMFGDMMADLQSGFIVTNNIGDRRSDVAHYSPGYGPPRGAVTGRVVVGDQVVYLSVSAMAEWCKTHDINVKDMKEVIKSRGWYKGEAPFRLGVGTLIALPATSTIKLDWKAFGSNINLVRDDPLAELEEAV